MRSSSLLKAQSKFNFVSLSRSRMGARTLPSAILAKLSSLGHSTSFCTVGTTSPPLFTMRWLFTEKTSSMMPLAFSRCSLNGR